MNAPLSLSDWIGRSETMDDIVTPTPYAALCATLDLPADRPQSGAVLPPLWHWLYFLPLHAQSALGPDGHARKGGFLPPITRPRRMWAGGQFEFHAPLRVGDAVQRRSTIMDVAEKSGRSGALTFVKVKHEVFRIASGEHAITEYHDIVYRDPPAPDSVPATPLKAPAGGIWSRHIVPDDVLLFRYSALTFNGHRIHYDRRYVTGVEGYPGLIVHGPLIATLLIDLVREHCPAQVVTGFEFRALHPTFDLHPFSVHGEPIDDRTVRLWAEDHEGTLTMQATARLG